MSVKHLGDKLWAGVTTLLRAQGFEKRAKGLVRISGALEERFRLEGSHWNIGTEPYKFYLGISMRLIDVPLPMRCEGSPLPDRPEVKRWGHAAGRQRCADPEAPLQLEVTSAGLDQMIVSLAELIEQASETLQRCEPIVRQAALQGEYIPLWRAAKRSRERVNNAPCVAKQHEVLANVLASQPPADRNDRS